MRSVKIGCARPLDDRRAQYDLFSCRAFLREKVSGDLLLFRCFDPLCAAFRFCDSFADPDDFDVFIAVDGFFDLSSRYDIYSFVDFSIHLSISSSDSDFPF